MIIAGVIIQLVAIGLMLDNILTIRSRKQLWTSLGAGCLGFALIAFALTF